jgi:hypothetical protein
MYALLFFVVSCCAAYIMFRLWRRPYPRESKSLNIWFGPIPAHGEDQVRYYLKDALYALAWCTGLFLPVLLLARWGVRAGFGSESPVTLQVVFAILLALAYLMSFNFASCLIKAFFVFLFRRRRVFNESLGKFVTERNYR